MDHGDTAFRPNLRFTSRGALSLFVVAVFAGSANAHPGHGSDGLGSGFAHPFTGLDHLLAMLAVGLWAAQQGGRRMWQLPLVFLALMAGGAALGAAGVAMSGIETGLAMSLLVLGVLIAGCVKLPALAGALLVGAFALVHGHAHGAELPANAGALGYAAGFLASTALLQATGLGLGLALRRGESGPRLARTLGAATAIAGVLLLIG
jgi:urease accessory protein